MVRTISEKSVVNLADRIVLTAGERAYSFLNRPRGAWPFINFTVDARLSSGNLRNDLIIQIMEDLDQWNQLERHLDSCYIYP